jgi:hypothetical protein
MGKQVQDISVMLAEEVDDDEWDKICQLILDELRANGYVVWEVCIY